MMRFLKRGSIMRRISVLPVLFLLLAAIAVAAQDVRYNFDKDTDFSRFKTYKWVELKGAQKPDDITDKQIKEAIDAELAKKGLIRTTADDADIFLGYQV